MGFNERFEERVERFDYIHTYLLYIYTYSRIGTSICMHVLSTVENAVEAVVTIADKMVQTPAPLPTTFACAYVST